MADDPRIQRITSIKQTIKQNPYVANKNSMLKPLYLEILRLEEIIAELQLEIASRKATPKKEKNNGAPPTE